MSELEVRTTLREWILFAGEFFSLCGLLGLVVHRAELVYGLRHWDVWILAGLAVGAVGMVVVGVWEWRWRRRRLFACRLVLAATVILSLVGTILLDPQVAYTRAEQRLTHAEASAEGCTPNLCRGMVPPEAAGQYQLHRDLIAKRRAELESARLALEVTPERSEALGALMLLGVAASVLFLTVRQKDLEAR